MQKRKMTKNLLLERKMKKHKNKIYTSIEYATKDADLTIEISSKHLKDLFHDHCNVKRQFARKTRRIELRK